MLDLTNRVISPQLPIPLLDKVSCSILWLQMSYISRVEFELLTLLSAIMPSLLLFQLGANTGKTSPANLNFQLPLENSVLPNVVMSTCHSSMGR